MIKFNDPVSGILNAHLEFCATGGQCDSCMRSISWEPVINVTPDGDTETTGMLCIECFKGAYDEGHITPVADNEEGVKIRCIDGPLAGKTYTIEDDEQVIRFDQYRYLRTDLVEQPYVLYKYDPPAHL